MRSRRERQLWALLFVCALVIVWSHRRLSAALTWRFPAVNELVVTEHYMGDIGALMLGARRLAADVAYIQFLQYYGLSENAHHHDEEDAHEDDHEKPTTRIERLRKHDMSKGNYPRLLELSRRVLRLDPYFNTVILEAAGALAFNQKRIDESLALLREGIERDPSFYRYHLYVAAILYKEKGNDEGMINLLLQAIRFPDCPPLFEMVLGNLLKRAGRYSEAAAVYFHTYSTAAKDFEREDARRRLSKLLEEHPEVKRQFAPAPVSSAVALPG